MPTEVAQCVYHTSFAIPGVKAGQLNNSIFAFILFIRLRNNIYYGMQPMQRALNPVSSSTFYTLSTLT